ncbi:DUF1214 domain-containing protein [Mycolicibacterium pyrenivorans]|uniref:DUF1214 domain-containing protein n=1 Tax=Mycolicibacterium pyrenivorans TaxID=187102 RepID=UPI0021F34A11|nr:DUF1214 domain-containing protein [Mycolicibacterium pyrenivorans]
MPTAHAESDGSSSSGSSSSGSSSSDSSDSSSPSDSSDSPSTSDQSDSSDSNDAKTGPAADSEDEAPDEDASITDPSDPDERDSRRTRSAADDALDDAAGEEAATEDQTVAVATSVATATSEVEVAAAPPARSAPGEPQAPVASPAEWALAAYTRREVGHTTTAPDTTAAVTTQVTATQDTANLADSALSNQVSPLGTPEQIARERIAIRTANSLPVAFMKLILRIGFLAAAKEQFALVGGPDAANREALNRAVDEYALAAAFQQQILNPMDPAVVTQVAPPHSWYGIDVAGSRLLYDNPDTIYRFMPVNKTSEYVLTGRLYDGIPADTTFSVLEGTAGTTSTILTLSDLVINEDGTFVITVSGEAAAPGQTNHLQLTSRSTLIAARNTLGDWNTEDPMELSIHRVSGPRNSLFAQLGGFVLLGGLVNDSPLLTSLVSLVPPLRIAETPLVRGSLTALLLIVRGANEQAKYMALATTDPDTGELRPPNVMTQPESNAEFLANQLQSNGYFQLADDEALVLTIDPGNAGFFTVPVYNDWTITDDYWNQQTSLNNAQAVANPDGTYTMVVAKADPGVANWVSTGGLNQGIISMRFQNLDPESTDAPAVQSAVVKLEDLDEELPAATVYVTPEQRAAQLAERKAGFDKRWAPYVQ